MRRLAWLLALSLAACSSAPEAPSTPPDPVPITRPKVRRHVAPKGQEEAPKAFVRPPAPAPLGKRERLAAAIGEADAALNKGDWEAARAALAEPLAAYGAREALLTGAETLPREGAWLSLQAELGAALTAWVEAEMTMASGTPVRVVTNAGGRFPAFLLEDYEGAADRQEVKTFRLRRLDGIEVGIARRDAGIQRLDAATFEGLVAEFLELRAERVGADRPLGAWRLMALAWTFKTPAQARVWLERALATEQCEVLLSLYARGEPAALAELRRELAIATEGRSVLPPPAQSVAALPPPAERPSTEAPAREPTPAVEPAPGEPVAEEPEAPASIDPAPAAITASFDKGLAAYREAADPRAEQARLRVAQRHFEAAMEAWNALEERDPAAAAKMEQRISEMGILLYDIIKRRKLR